MRPQKVFPWVASLFIHLLLFTVFLAFLVLRNTAGSSGPRVRVLTLSLEQGGGAGEAKPAAPPAASPAPAHPPDSPAPVLPETTPKGSPVTESSVASVPEASPSETSTPGGEGGEIGWEGSGRAVIRSPAIAFPRVLSASGQEADVEARITVSPLGTVTKVEIIMSSGYTEIDTGVEAALRGYQFTEDYGFDKKSAIGIVKFHFRLEKPD